jgi:hypothetical protein
LLISRSFIKERKNIKILMSWNKVIPENITVLSARQNSIKNLFRE